ncbi:MAG: tyrosine-type recombinase/integrase [Lachnospiraceae bacterium]|nr:tyrosine-type recombinase/integrase [Lachnospiraceae bacterium]
MADESYHIQVNKRNQLKLRALLSELPAFCKEYFIGIEQQTQSRTRIAYAYDLGIFFHFMHETNAYCKKFEIADFDISILDKITPTDIEEYLSYLQYYVKDGKEYTNDERGIVRKLASLKSFYNYFYRKEKIERNAAELVKLPKRHEKNIIRMDADEVARFLDQVENGDKLTSKQQAFHEQTKVRDLAIMTLLLGTGIRVSECVGINMNDVDFENSGIKIFRKGGYESVVYFGDEVQEALSDYYYERKGIEAMPGSTDALFLSLQKKRISVRAVENLVKKYSKTVTTLKNITPHKLRSTYGTELYRETGDIYLVADVLGHKDVNTTKKHYAAIEDERRRQAAKVVHLRKD